HDAVQFASWTPSWFGYVAEYVAEHARKEDYARRSAPKVLMETDDDLALGEFGIATRMVQPRRGRGAPADGGPPPQAEPGATMIYKPKATPQATEAASPAELGVEREVVVLSWDGERREIDKRRVVLGRSRDCDIQLADPNVSRR